MAVIGVVLGGWLLYGLEKGRYVGVPITTASPAAAQVLDQSQISAAAKKAMPSVVTVASTKTVKYNPRMSPFSNDPFFRRFFGDAPDREGEQTQRGLGSGVVVSEDGYILTNAHVVAQADDIEVYLYDDRVLKAEVKGADEASDVAVLKIDAKDLPALLLADSDRAEVGDIVLAIGSPYELGNTVTMGIISAKGRTDLRILGKDGIEDFIQTDAAINPGNSGGALINLNGELVGINTAIFTRTGGYQGIGFAIPANLARRVMDSLIQHGEVVRGWLGVGIQNITPELAEQFGLKDTKGVLVSGVEDNSPAASAGFKTGDVIRKVNGRDVDSPTALRSMIGTKAPGAEVTLDIVTDGQEGTRVVKIGKAPKDLEAVASGQPGVNGDTELLPGVWVSDLTSETRDSMGLPKSAQGVVITRTDAEKVKSSMPLQPGDLILAVNQQKVASVVEAQQVIKAGKRDTVLLLVQRGRYTIFTTVKK